jgi:hypothetical protein
MDIGLKVEINGASINDLVQLAREKRLEIQARDRMETQRKQAEEDELKLRIVLEAEKILPLSLAGKVAFGDYARQNSSAYLIVDGGDDWHVLMHMFRDERTWKFYSANGFQPMRPQIYLNEESGLFEVMWMTTGDYFPDLIEAIALSLEHQPIAEVKAEADRKNIEGETRKVQPKYVPTEMPDLSRLEVIGALESLVKGVTLKVLEERGL